MYGAVAFGTRFPDPIGSLRTTSNPAAALPDCPETPKRSNGDRFGADGEDKTPSSPNAAASVENSTVKGESLFCR